MTDKDVAQRFAKAVEGLFESDANWSLFDLDGAEEFYERFGLTPSPESLEVEEY